MNWSSGLSWLAALKAPSPELICREADCADMGTAFGLDASFGLHGEEPMRAGAGALQESSLPWEHRLTRRSGL
jgi:hypothetical protein